MQRLSGQDAGFLYMELPIQPMNSMILAIVGPAASDDGRPRPLTRDDLRAHMAHRLGELPSFRWLVRPVPFGLHHPVFVDDPHFDLDFHIREATLPSPGTPSQLDRFAADSNQRHLDRRHPLWQLTVISGLEDGRQAIMLRYHHCMADGVAALTTVGRVYSGLDHEVIAPAEPWHPEPTPSSATLVIHALRDQARDAVALGPLVRRTVRNLRAVARYERDLPVKVPRFVLDTPACSVNDAFTSGRSYARLQLPIDDVRFVRKVAGVRLNDLALAIIAGGLRRYLDARGDLPSRPLTASVPVAFEAADAPVRQHGNRFSSFTTTLATDVDDPWERLLRISTVAASAKGWLDVLGVELMAEWLEFAPPPLASAAMRLHHRRRRANRDRADVNVLVSNMKGPTDPYAFGSATVEEIYLDGPPSNGVGANVLLFSYRNQLSFGILCFADAVAAPEELAQGFRDALTELVDLAHTRAAAAAATVI